MFTAGVLGTRLRISPLDGTTRRHRQPPVGNGGHEWAQAQCWGFQYVVANLTARWRH